MKTVLNVKLFLNSPKAGLDSLWYNTYLFSDKKRDKKIKLLNKLLSYNDQQKVQDFKERFVHIGIKNFLKFNYCNKTK